MRDPEIEAVMEPLLLCAGAGLVDCQRLEYGLGLLLLYLARLGVPGISADRMRAVLDGEEKLTAGQLNHLLGQKADVTPELESLLADGLQGRNTLIHGFLLRNFHRTLAAQSREEVLSELRALRMRIQAAEHAIRPHVNRLAATLDGVTAEQMQDLALRAFRGEVADPWGRRTNGCS
jgi:hypothetical protein